MTDQLQKGTRIRITTDAYVTVPRPGTLATIIEDGDSEGDILISFDEPLYDYESRESFRTMWAQRKDFEIVSS